VGVRDRLRTTKPVSPTIYQISAVAWVPLQDVLKDLERYNQRMSAATECRGDVHPTRFAYVLADTFRRPQSTLTVLQAFSKVCEERKKPTASNSPLCPFFTANPGRSPSLNLSFFVFVVISFVCFEHNLPFPFCLINAPSFSLFLCLDFVSTKRTIKKETLL